jgi:hypothetical protein
MQAGDRQGRRGLAAGRPGHAGRTPAGVPRRRLPAIGVVTSAADRAATWRGAAGLDRRSAAGAARRRAKCCTARPGLARRAGLRDLHLRLDRQAEGHPDHPAQHLPLPAQRKRRCWASAPTTASTRAFRSPSTCRSRRSGSLPGRRHAVDRPKEISRRPRSAAAHAGRQRRHRAARGAHPAGPVRRGRADPAPDQPGRRDVPRVRGRALARPGRQMFNTYGPTEATVSASLARCAGPARSRSARRCPTTACW